MPVNGLCDTVLGVRFNRPNLRFNPSAPAAVLPERVQAGVLPFTGGEVAPFLIVGGVLIMTGGLLATRKKRVLEPIKK
jgi:LPXTG-motif cell wall-anchored protein